MIRTLSGTPSFALLLPRMEPAPPDVALLELTNGLMRGQDDAWRQFHREHGPVIFRQLLAATRGDHDLASEALQQTDLRIARHARPCDSAAMFHSWLRLVARTALRDCQRRQRSFWQLLLRRHAEPTENTAADAVAAEDRLLVILDKALTQLDPANRSLLEAKYFSGHSVRAIAISLAISEKAVESRLTRARGELRRHLETLPA